jgi:hypothetical protein
VRGVFGLTTFSDVTQPIFGFHLSHAHRRDLRKITYPYMYFQMSEDRNSSNENKAKLEIHFYEVPCSDGTTRHTPFGWSRTKIVSHGHIHTIH